MIEITDEMRLKMAVLDAAADEAGDALIEGIGERYTFTTFPPLGAFYYLTSSGGHSFLSDFFNADGYTRDELHKMEDDKRRMVVWKG